MKKSVMKKWVVALRSGEYKQGDGRLVDNTDCFCCLGVLCNIAPDTLGIWEQDALGHWGFRSKNGYSEQFLLPLPVMEWAEIKDNAGFVGNTEHSREFCLTDLNDDGKTFKQIADIIEKHWDKL